MTEPLSARAQNEPVSSAEEPGPGAGYVVRQRWRRLVSRREVVFAVHAGGVYFGSGRPPETVPWDLIRAVELFREIEPHLGSAETVFQCIGARHRNPAGQAAGQRAGRDAANPAGGAVLRRRGAAGSD